MLDGAWSTRPKEPVEEWWYVNMALLADAGRRLGPGPRLTAVLLAKVFVRL